MMKGWSNMTKTFIDPVAEVRHNRELLLEKHGGMDGLLKHMEEERPKLEAQGWVFMPIEEIIAKNRANREAEVQA